MIDRDDALRDLLAEELGDSWQPGSFPRMNLLSYQERQQLKNGPDPAFVEEKLAEAERGFRRTSRACDAFVVLALLLMPMLSFFEDGSWGLELGGVAVLFAALVFIVQRHAHHRKRRLIYRTLRLLAVDETPVSA